MAVTFSDVERMLVNEQKKCDDHLIIGGLEAFINNWIKRIQQDNETEMLARAQTVEQILRGYHAADPKTRQTMLTRALDALRDHLHVIVTPEPLADDEPADEFDDDDEDPAFGAPMRAAPTHPKRAAPRAPVVSAYGLDASVTHLQNVGPAYAKKLQRLGIYTINDLLYHFPHRYDDYSKLKTISELVFSEEVTVILTVCECFTRIAKNNLVVTTVVLADMTGTITATFFRQPYLQKQFRAGRRIVISGRVDMNLSRLAFTHPEWEPLSKALLNTARIVPVYPLTEGVSRRWMRYLINAVVEYWADKVADPIPATLREKAKLVNLTEALREIHFPSTEAKKVAARRRLIIDEFLTIQLGVLQQRLHWRGQPGKALTVSRARIHEFFKQLPFQFTAAQTRVLEEILADLQHAYPMSRLLQGDVGSGKTVVAATALLTAVENGAQAALMAPTEILADQHYKSLYKLFAGLPHPPRIGLLIGAMKDREKEETRAKLAAGAIDIIVGTHALIQSQVEFRELALAVIDEQHRFGVEQRGMIRAKGYAPHMLVMSATPIPRTLALTLYGDLDLSIIDQMPPGRQPITTKWLDPSRRERAYDFIQTHVNAGEQAFVICPLIEESEEIDARAAVEEYERLRTQNFSDLRVGLIHGKLRPSEKEAVMSAFRDHQLDVLVATSVIEVGIDVPNATVMLIENADRFGLAQLHQFRGRVGRGRAQSFCMLLAAKKDTVSDERLKVIETTENGFLLAEEDLKLRGPGEFFGTRQSGLPNLKIAKLGDARLLEEARALAQEIFDRDNELQLPEHQLLAQRVKNFWRTKGDLS